MGHSGFRLVHDGFVAGDAVALRLALGDPPDFPNNRLPFAYGMGDWPLCYAIAWSPIALIERLLDLGACVTPEVLDGFPPLISVLSGDRPDALAVLGLLLRRGADPNERGLADMTPLHMAVARRDLPAVDLLLAFGADPDLPTRIDDMTTPREDAATQGFAEALALMARITPA